MEEKNLIASIKRIYRQTDEEMNAMESCCSRGCSFCCYQTIKIAAVEELLIVQYLKKFCDRKKIATLKENISKWLDYFDSQTVHGKQLVDEDISLFEQTLVRDNVPCPLLINNECAVYPARPVVCRTHSVKSNPTLCNENKLRDPENEAKDVRLRKCKELMEIGPISYIRLLPYALAHYFVPGRKLKPVLIHGFAKKRM